MVGAAHDKLSPVTNPGFEASQWPMRHAYVIEECRALHVSDVLFDLPLPDRKRLSSWRPPAHPQLLLVRRPGGPCIRWWLVCPRCRRRCENLYIPPTRGGRDDWRCRKCWSLIYASQRFGERHPLSRKLTHRKKVTKQKVVIRQQRRLARLTARQPEFTWPVEPRDPEADRRSAEAWRHANEMFASGKVLVVEVPESAFGSCKPVPVRERWVDATELKAADSAIKAIEDRLRAEAGRSLAVLRELSTTARSKRERERAERSYKRACRRLGRMRHLRMKVEAGASRRTYSASRAFRQSRSSG